MRSFASVCRLLACWLVLALAALAAPALIAQDAPAAALLEDARSLEATLRKDIAAYRTSTPSMPLIRRARILVGTYEDIARLFPEGGYGDKSLWQGASLAADVFDVFRDSADRATAVRLTEALEAKYPSSAFVAQAHRRVAGLALAPAPTPMAKPVAADPAPLAAPARTAARTTPPGALSLLRGIHREVLPDVLRVSIELDREVAFHEERIDGPPRVFVDLQNTRAATDIQDARLAFDDDVVRQIRVGRQLDRRIRVVLDLSEAPVHSVYTLYNPFRIVIDFERPRTGVISPVAPTRVASNVAAKPIRVPLPAVAKAVDAPATPSVPTVAPVPPATPVAAGGLEASVSADVKATMAAAPPAPVSPVKPAGSAAKREPVISAPPPARTPGGLSMSRQLGLGISRVVIDPGHGGHDPGAKKGDITESELVLDVALRLELLLQKEDIDVVLTRRSNVYVPLEERPALAMREEADLYLSIHANASEDGRVRGVETYILNFAPNAQSAAVAARENIGSSRTMKSLPDIVKTIALNNKFDESRDLARQVQATLVEKLSKGNRAVRNLGVKQAPFAVLVGADMPSILAEIGFITNKQDAALVKTAVYRQQIAEALAGGIVRYQKRLKPSQVAVVGSRP